MKKTAVSILISSLLLSNIGSTLVIAQDDLLEKGTNSNYLETNNDDSGKLRIEFDDSKCKPEEEVKTTSIEKETLGDYVTKSLFSTSSYSSVRSTVDLVKLWGNQWSVNAKSMARDQNGKPYRIDKIYAKGSIYYKDSNGSYVYKIGDSKTEANSADTMVEKISGKDSRTMLAQGSHRYEHKGYKTITSSTSDTNPKKN